MWLNEKANAANETITVNYTAIDGVFLHPEVAQRKIVAVSIIGAFRKGKSFMMDYCLRFMYANVSEKTQIDFIIFIKISYISST
jgi:Guanylate-binding protein, N-terminal domain